MTHFVTDSEVVCSTSNKNHHVFETEFMASESFFYNTPIFYATYEVTKPKGSEFLSFAAFIRRFISPLRFCIFSSHRRLATRRW